MRNPVPHVLFASIVLVLLGLIIFKRREESAVYEGLNPSGLPSYCGARPRGMEGMLHHPRSGLVLHAVVLTIRHGDRSAIHALPNTNETARWACRPAGLEQRRAAAAARVLGIDGRPLHRSLLPQTDGGEGGHCAPGQLTPRGFAQHAALGRHLGRAFAPLLRAISADHHSNTSHEPLYVRSTDYTRTLMSAAALLSGMLPVSMRQAAAAPLTIYTQEEERLELMHGVGLASSSKVKGDGGGERLRSGPCPKATELAQAQLAAWHDDTEALQELELLFGPAARRLPVTGVADVMYAHACHEMRPPCSLKDGCVPPALANRFFRAGDEAYCAKYNGLLGGLRASQLAMHPLLTEIVERLTRANGGGGERMVLLSGHDTVVAQLLAAIGGMRDGRHCRWPPYASRLVFELWRPALATANSLRRAPQIRVLYNGAVVTHLIPECARRMDSIDATTTNLAAVADLELCPLESFKQGTIGRIPQGSSFEAECRSDQGSVAAAA